jgi:hypothetical protein
VHQAFSRGERDAIGPAKGGRRKHGCCQNPRAEISKIDGFHFDRVPADKRKPFQPEKGWNGQRITVSPFDGLNRIRFKGSPGIVDCGIRIANFARINEFDQSQSLDSQPLDEFELTSHLLFNPHSAIANPQSPGSPETILLSTALGF